VVVVVGILKRLLHGAKMAVLAVVVVMLTTILLMVAMVMFLPFLQAKVTLVGHLLLLLVRRRMGQVVAAGLVQ
jgi:hypothetical protein